jgi:uncharacterized protein (DUF1684 family)
MRRVFLLSLMIAVAACGQTPSSAPPAQQKTQKATTVDPYQADIDKFRQQREAKLTSDTGWLTIAGLFFLTKPETTVGSAADNDVVLPASAPPKLGTLLLAKNNKVSVKLEPGVSVKLLDGKPFAGGPIKSDGEGPPDRMVMGDVQVWIHQSGERPAVRVRDKNHHLRKVFTGMKWFPVNASYKVEGTFVPFEKPKTFEIPNMLGDIDRMESPGHVKFTLNGKEHNMLAITEDEESFWFIFRDLTSADETYPAARFLYTGRPDANGKVTLDFNRAENPPCAFTPYSTCPLPPPENRLQVRVEAGEKIYERH